MQFLLNRIILHLSTMSVKADLSINRLGDKGRGNLNQIGCETEKDVSSTQGKVRKHRMRPSDKAFIAEAYQYYVSSLVVIVKLNV